jgi:hypothetical protein
MGLINDLLVRIRGDKTQLDSTLKGAEKSVSSFGASLKKAGAIMAAVFSVGEIAGMSKEAMKLAAEVEGVKNAFLKLGSSKSVLEDMKRATRGVMDESDLMALAVKANNYKIPLQDLSTYLEFATKRAITTGKSVKELTELIVTGLGRKSSRSFIQLGLSTKDVQSAMKDAGGIMRLVNDELTKMGDVSDTQATRFETLTANIHNFKEAWGEWLNQSKLIKSVINDLTTDFQMFADKEMTFMEKITFSPKEYREKQKNKERAKQIFGGDLTTSKEWKAPWASIITDKQINTLTSLNTELDLLKKELLEIDITDKSAIQTKYNEIAAIEAQIKAITDLGLSLDEIKKKQRELSKSSIENVNFLPQNNTTTSVFGKKTYGVAPARSNKLAPGGKITGTQEQANAMADAIEVLPDALNESQEALLGLADTFAGFFSDVNLGFQGMIDGVITGIKRLVAELLAKAVILAILNTLFPGSAVPLSLGNILGGSASKLVGGSVSSGGSVLGGSTIGAATGERLVASLTGKQIDITLRRMNM